MFIKKIFSFLTLLLLCSNTWGYANFIGYSYRACLNCHYNPYGNGPLTDYGRAVGATAISDDNLYPSTWGEQEISERSGFLRSKASTGNFRPSLNYRGLQYISNYDSDNQKSKYINMFLSANLAYRFGKEKKHVAVIEMGHAPTPHGSPNTDEAEFRSREHYVGIRPSDSLGFYAGLMDKVFGIRVPDHNLFSRSRTGLAMNDQSHGVLVHYNSEPIEAGLQYFVGNLSQEASLRQKGFTTRLGYSLGPMTKVEGSYLQSESEYSQIKMYEIDTRIGFGKGSAVMIELGQISKTVKRNLSIKKSTYLMTQSYVHLSRGLNSIITTEYLKPDTLEESYTIRVGPGIQYFPTNGLELRLDIYNTKNYSKQVTIKDVWDIAAQVHIWL